MASYQKRPGIDLAIIPGYGKLRPGETLTGEQYAKFCPSLLVEIPEAVMPAKVQPVAQVITEVMPVVEILPPPPAMLTETLPEPAASPAPALAPKPAPGKLSGKTKGSR